MTLKSTIARLLKLDADRQEWAAAVSARAMNKTDGWYRLKDEIPEMMQAIRTLLALNEQLARALETMEAKSAEARAHLTARPMNRPKCNIILLQMQQGKFSKEALAANRKEMGEGE